MPKFKRGVEKINKPVVRMVKEKIDSTNLDDYSSRTKLVSWINGVAVPEKNPELKSELLRLRREISSYGS